MPAATSPRASATTSSRNCPQVTSAHASPWRRRNCTTSGAATALSHTGSVRLAASPTVTTGGTENSRTWPPTERDQLNATYPYRHRVRCGGPASRQPVGSAQRGSLPHMADSSTQAIEIDATPAQVAAVICDFTRYPEWTTAMQSAEVIEEYEDGYASQVRFVIDAGVLMDEYTLQYEYAEDISRIEWHLVAPSKMQKTQNGSYDIEPVGD